MSEFPVSRTGSLPGMGESTHLAISNRHLVILIQAMTVRTVIRRHRRHTAPHRVHLIAPKHPKRRQAILQILATRVHPVAREFPAVYGVVVGLVGYVFCVLE